MLSVVWDYLPAILLFRIILVHSDIGPYIIHPTPYSPQVILTKEEINKSLTYWEFFPDILQKCPDHVFQAMFRGDVKVNFGNKMTILATETPPYNLSWPTENDALYLFHLFDPDVPSKVNRSLGEFRHWTVGNIPGTDVSKGFELVEYHGILRNHSRGQLHRYVFVVYKQLDSKPLEFDDYVIKKTDEYLLRTGFSHRYFAREHRLGDPIAVNFFH